MCYGGVVRCVSEACGARCVGDGVTRRAKFGWRCKKLLINAKKVCVLSMMKEYDRYLPATVYLTLYI